MRGENIGRTFFRLFLFCPELDEETTRGGAAPCLRVTTKDERAVLISAVPELEQLSFILLGHNMSSMFLNKERRRICFCAC